MSRAYVTYICVAAFCIAGLWVILTYGNSLEAPPDISGDWRVKWGTPPPFSPAEGVMKVQQSGRFIQVTFDKSNPMSLKLDDVHSKRQELRHPVLTMRNNIWKLTLSGNLRSEVRIDLAGPTRHTGTAARSGAKPATTNNAH